MKRFVWPGMVFALIGVNVAIVAVTVFASRRDSSYALVPAYDRKAMHFQEEIDRRAASTKLGWTIEAVITQSPDGTARVAFELRDAARTPITGAELAISFFHHAHAANRRDSLLSETAPGFYASSDRLAQKGLWRFEVAAQRGDDRFETALDQAVGAAP
jgi:nitrogen fixation protein FixH